MSLGCRPRRIAAAALLLAALACTGAHAAPSSLEVGCPWVDGSDVETKNTGFPDANATYGIIWIPVNPGPSVEYVIRGKYPKVRYFGFQSYDGFRPGNLIDSLPDARIRSNEGAAPAANPAVLPDNGGYTYTYEVRIKYAKPPANPADREPNVLYAGLDSERGALVKQVVYRTYLANPGSNRLGDEPRPSVTYVGPKGEIDLRQTPETARCEQLKEGTNSLTTFPVLGMANAQPKWKPVSGAGQYVYYPNGDINYLKALIAARNADLVLIRSKKPTTAGLPGQGPANPNTRYWSLCQNELNTSKVVKCLADREMTVQGDGTINVVISTPAKKPSNARPESGFDWLPHGDADEAVAGFRQLLANPAFAGNYAKSVAQPNAPVGDTLGEWAPLITYCDRATFDSMANQGGDAVFKACKQAYRTWWQGLLSLGL
ncbi:MAG TPA: hypothetical protein VJM11_10140 [Nevskiaceae bacterium]|nr:hypothetical protein [Nevskiaceae bacterium]